MTKIHYTYPSFPIFKKFITHMPSKLVFFYNLNKFHILKSCV